MAGSININQNNNKITLQDQNGKLIVTDNNKNTSVDVTSPTTKIVEVNTLGPQGAVGPVGPVGPTGGSPSGSLSLTGSLDVSGSAILGADCSDSIQLKGSVTASCVISQSMLTWPNNQNTLGGDLTVYGRIRSVGSDITLMSGSITASGNISASGDIMADLGTGSFAHLITDGSTFEFRNKSTKASEGFMKFDPTSGLSISNAANEKTAIKVGDVGVTDTSGNNVRIKQGHITASGNISSSGTGSFSRLDVEEYIYHKDDNTYIRFLPDRIVAVASNNTVLNLNVGADLVEFGHTGKNSVVKGSTVSITGSVSASANISASGNIIGVTGSFQHLIGDFSGSVTNALTASYVLQAVSASYAISASHEIVYETSSSHAVTADTASYIAASNIYQPFTNITASGNISSSGIVYASGLEVIHSGSLNPDMIFKTSTDHDLNVAFEAGVTTPSKFQIKVRDEADIFDISSDTVNPIVRIPGSGGLSLSGSLTASGNISSSGNLTISQSLTFGGDDVRIDFGEKLTIGNSSEDETIKIVDESIKFYIAGGEALVLNDNSNQILIGYAGGIDKTVIGSGANAMATFDSTNQRTFLFDEVTIGQSNLLSYTGDALFTVSGSSKFYGHITASGNISASGDITGVTGSFQHLIGDLSGSVTNALTASYVAADNIHQPFTNITASGNISASGYVNTDLLQGDNGWIDLNAASSAIGLAANNVDAYRFFNTAFRPQVTGVDLGVNVSIYRWDNFWVNTINAAGNISSSGNISTLSHITASGNISASEFIIGKEITSKGEYLGGGGNSTLNYSGSNAAFYGNNYISFAKEGNTTYRTYEHGVGYSNKMYFSGSGYIGIGTTSPKEKLHVNGNITSSGNITGVTGSFQHLIGDFSGSISNALTSSYILASNIDQPFTNITASGNISASGNIIASNIFVPGAGKISFDDTLDGSDQFITGNDNNITIDADNILKFRADQTVEFQDTSNNSQVTVNPIAGHITASGNISSSGTVRALDMRVGSGYDGIIRFGPAGDKNFPQFRQIEANQLLLDRGNDENLVKYNFPQHSDGPKVLVEGHISSSGYISTLSDITSSGNISSSGDLYAKEANLTTGNNGGVLFRDSNPTGTVASTITYNSNGINLFNSPSNPSSNTHLIVSCSGGTGMANARIGIGTITPGEMLEVAGNISASGNLYGDALYIDNQAAVGSLAGEITLAHSSLDLKSNAPNNEFLGHITASGNISSSGLIYANQYAVGNNFLLGDIISTTGRVYNGTGTTAIEIGRSSTPTKNISLYGPVTASGNISASGHVYAKSYYSHGHSSLKWDGSTLNINPAAGPGNFYPTRIYGHITASGNISASSNIIAHDITHPVQLVNNQYNGETVTFGNGPGGVDAAITIGKLYSYTGNKYWEQADANTLAPTGGGLLGMAVSTGEVRFLIKGTMTHANFSGLDTGEMYYMSETAAAITPTAPTTAASYVRVLGWVVDGGTNTIYFNPDNTWVKV